MDPYLVQCVMYVCMYVYSRGGPQTAPAPRPSLIYCALQCVILCNINCTSGYNVSIKIKIIEVYLGYILEIYSEY
jgi:hypothetical protein